MSTNLFWTSGRAFWYGRYLRGCRREPSSARHPSALLCQSSLLNRLPRHSLRSLSARPVSFYALRQQPRLLRQSRSLLIPLLPNSSSLLHPRSLRHLRHLHHYYYASLRPPLPRLARLDLAVPIANEFLSQRRSRSKSKANRSR